MNQAEKDLRLAAAGYPVKKKSRRKPRIKINLDNPEVLHQIKLGAAQKVLDSVGGHRRIASEMLGIHVRTLYKWLKQMSE